VVKECFTLFYNLIYNTVDRWDVVIEKLNPNSKN